MSRDEATTSTPTRTTTDPAEVRSSAPARRILPRSRRSDVAVITGLALFAWAALIALCRAWALLLEAQGRQLILFTPPILGGYRTGLPDRIWLPILAGAALIGALPALASRLRWSATLVLGAVGAGLWWLALALVDGREALTRGLLWQADWADAIPGINADPARYLSTFVERLPTYGIQVRAHPPGLPLVLAGLDRVGLGGPGWAAALVYLSAALGVVAVLVAVREVCDEDTARRALPFVALAPAAAWIAISFDAMYMGVAAWFITLVILAMRRSGRRADLFAAGAGVLAAACVLLSYGLVLMGCGALIAGIALRRWRPLLIAAGVAMACVLAFVPFGYWWIAGLFGTKEQYDTFGLDRPYGFFVVNNLAAWALVLGPATAVALARLRDRRLWILVGGGLAAALIADLTGLSNAEVERIWLPFALWVLPAAAVLGGHRYATRGWLALQVGSAVALTAVVSPFW